MSPEKRTADRASQQRVRGTRVSTCPVCLEGWAVNSDDTMRRHPYGVPTECAGTGMLAVYEIRGGARTAPHRVLVDGAETVGLLRELAVLGYGCTRLAAKLGMHPGGVHDIREGRERVLASTASAVAAVAAELRKMPPPDDARSAAVRAYAAERGWSVPSEQGAAVVA